MINEYLNFTHQLNETLKGNDINPSRFIEKDIMFFNIEGKDLQAILNRYNGS